MLGGGAAPEQRCGGLKEQNVAGAAVTQGRLGQRLQRVLGV